jgi:hypothetical protein
LRYFSGKRKFSDNTTQGFGIYRISDEFVAPGTEHLIPANFVEEYNKKLRAEGRGVYETCRSPFTLVHPMDEKFFHGSKFTIQTFLLTETTAREGMVNFGFPDWGTSTCSKLCFCFRPGDMFALTMGRSADVIEPYWDSSFPQIISDWIGREQRTAIHRSALFYNRHTPYDVLIALSIMARVYRGEDVKPESIGPPSRH